MGFIDKFKEIFFEPVEPEEYVPKKEVTVAKKIELPPETKRVREEPAIAVMEQKEKNQEEIKPARQLVDFDDRDFKMEGAKEEKYQEPKSHYEEIEEEIAVYQEPAKQETIERKYESVYEKSYETSSMKQEKRKEYSGLYEGNDRKKEFRPSPIISPIYGVLDKNYRKEEIVSKSEMRLQTATTSKRIDIDKVREKAYGDLASEITASILGEDEVEEKEEPTPSEENLLYDLNDDSAPKIAKVTVGDAEEYFNELGLEYNVDYQDSSTDKKKEEPEKKETKEPIEEKETEEISKKQEKKEEPLENNLFDLIDTMYEEKE